MKFCPNCGASLEPAWLHCPNCGQEISGKDINEPPKDTARPDQGLSGKWYKTWWIFIFFWWLVALWWIWTRSKLSHKSKSLVTAVLGIFLVWGVLVVIALPGDQKENQPRPSVAGKELETSALSGQESKFSKERAQALSMLFDYELQEDFKYLSPSGVDRVVKGTPLLECFNVLMSAGLLEPTEQIGPGVSKNGWFAVKEGERIVTGWIGRRGGNDELLAGNEHTPQWQVANGRIMALNGTAKKYTPQLAMTLQTEDGGGLAAKVKDRFNEIVDQEVLPEYDRRMDEAKTSQERTALNEWYDEQEKAAMEKVAREHKISYEQANDIYLAGGMAEVQAGREFADQSKVLAREEIAKLAKEQGELR